MNVYIAWYDDEGHCGDSHTQLLEIAATLERAQATAMAKVLLEFPDAKATTWEPPFWGGTPQTYWLACVHSERWGREETRYHVTEEAVEV